MNTARIVVLSIALLGGGLAAQIASRSTTAPAAARPVAQTPSVDVLVARSPAGPGRSVRPEDLQLQSWPAASANSAFIRSGDRADAERQIIGSIAAMPFDQGKPAGTRAVDETGDDIPTATTAQK